MAGMVHFVINALDTQVVSMVLAKNPGSANAMKVGVDYSATRISTIARITSLV